jgi:C4-dicarboxylate-specific signal transduction histidine kinase
MADKLLTTKQLTEKLDTIDTTVNRIAKIVRSLKNLSRKSSNEKMESCLLRNIFQDVLALCDIGLKKNNIHLEIDKSNRLMDLTISCYQIQFSQVLINIITNAIDAVEGQVNAWIKITLTEDNDNIFIHVKDSGPGIPNDHRSKIFDAFYTTKKLGKGTGLGLSISKNIMEAHEGDIYLAPLEEGSVFIIRLPKHAEKMINEAQTG